MWFFKLHCQYVIHHPASFPTTKESVNSWVLILLGKGTEGWLVLLHSVCPYGWGMRAIKAQVWLQQTPLRSETFGRAHDSQEGNTYGQGKILIFERLLCFSQESQHHWQHIT